MTPQAFAATVKAKYPAYASKDDDELVKAVIAKYPEYASKIDQAPMSVADQARQSLASRGLTPEQVKAGQGVATPDQIKFADPSKEHGGFWSGVGQAVNPVNWFHMDPVTATAVALIRRDPSMLPGVRHLQGPASRGEKPEVMDALGAAMQEAGLPNFIETAKESYHRGEANQSRADMYGGVAGSAALSALTLGAAKTVPKIGPAMERAGVSQYADTLAEEGSPNRPLAETIGSRLGQEGVRLTNAKKEIGPLANERANAVDTISPILNRSEPAPVQPILDQIASDRAALFQPVRRVPLDSSIPIGEQIKALQEQHPQAEIISDGNNLVVNEIRHPSMWDKAKELNVLSKNIQDKAPEGYIPNETLLNLTRDYNYMAGTEGGYRVPGVDPVRLPANANAADAIRTQVNADPATAAANAEKSLWVQAANDLPKSAQKAPYLTMKHLIPSGGLELVTMANRIRTSPLWRTTMGGLKMRVGRALASSDAGAMGDLYSAIVAGESLGDDYGHDEAVHNLVTSAYQQANDNPNIARQLMHNKEAVYENPDGSVVPVPRHITNSFINAIGIDKAGAGVQYGNPGVAQGNAQGGQGPAGGQANVQEQDVNYPKRQSAAVEFPVQGERDENDAAFMRRTDANGNPLRYPMPKVMPSQVLPEQFKNARQVAWGTPMPGVLPDSDRGLYGLEFDQNKRRTQTAPANDILINRGGVNEPGTYAHEVNHAVYQKDLTSDQKRVFQSKVVESINRAAQARQTGGPGAEQAVIRTIPKAVIAYANMYPNNHDRAFNEMFAELGAQYIMNPTAFKQTYPDWYGLYKSLYKKEYIGIK